MASRANADAEQVGGGSVGQGFGAQLAGNAGSFRARRGMGAGWGAGVLDQHGELTPIRRRWLRFWLTALGSLIPRTLDFLWQSHPWGYRVGRGELFLASGGRKNFRKADTLCPAENVLWGQLHPSPNSYVAAVTPPELRTGVDSEKGRYRGEEGTMRCGRRP